MTTENDNSTQILSPTQMKELGKKLHNTPAYAINPHKAIVDFVTPFLASIHLGPAKVLVATFRQPEKTAGGLLKTDSFLEEDKFQGVCGLLLKMGPLSFSDDHKFKFGGFRPTPFDWVALNPQNGRATELRGLHCRISDDADIEAISDDPELFW